MEDRIGKWVIRNRNKRRFLVVDDEPDLTMLRSLALEYYGFKVEIFPGSGNTFTVTSDKAGTYNYICAIHPYMTGSIVVR